MRILDRQRYWAYLKAYLICFTSLVGLNIVIDAFSNFDEFTKRATGATELFPVMGRFYLVHMSEYYDRLCGVIGMMAAIFTVTWMQKDNELLAMLAAGISTQRVIRPVIVSALLVSALSVANQEWIMPELADELQRSHDDDGSTRVHVSGRYDSHMIYIHGLEADRKNQTVVSFNATIPVELFGALHELKARQARYIPETARKAPLRGGWLLRGVTDLNLSPDDGELGNDVLVKLKDDKGFPPPVGDLSDLGGDTYFLYTSLTFRAVTRRRHWYEYAPTLDLVRSLSDLSNERDKEEISVFLHNRILRTGLAMALLFLTLPQVLGGYGRNMFVSLGMSLGTAAIFYGLCFMSRYLGAQSEISPEMSAWLPLIVFGTIAVVRWDMIRT